LKLAQLLAQYLYTNKHLELPGLGSFLLDPNMEFEQVTDKQGKKVNMEGASVDLCFLKKINSVPVLNSIYT